MERINVNDFSEIEADFLERVNKMVWCNVATVDRKGRPRSRVLHPIWEGSTGWILTWRNTLKSKHLAENPHVSLAYVAEPLKPVYADCTAEWIDDAQTIEYVWKLFKAAPEPLGYDPGLIFGTQEHPNLGLLKLTPWRAEVYTIAVDTKIWHQAV
ncbi:MAG: pyridoxamine 5'-phosphate oxidase family protein [Chloroflexota bacterium]